MKTFVLLHPVYITVRTDLMYHYIDWILLGITCSSLIIYHVIYICNIYNAKTHPYIMQYYITSDITDKWIKKHFHVNVTANFTLEAIHTIRNLILVGIFLGGYSLNTTLTVLLNYKGNEPIIFQIKDIIICTCLNASFLCWSQVINHCSELSYMIGDYTTDVNMNTQHSLYGQYLSKTCIMYFSFALRFLYISIPFAYLSVSSILTLLVTVLLLICEYIWDYGYKCI